MIDLGKRTLLHDGDVIVMCTDGFWSVLSKDEIANWLASTPILQTAPKMMREAEKRGGDEGDNLSAIVVRWGAELLPDEPSTTITETMGLGEFETQIDRTLTLTDRTGAQRDLTDDEIERAIAEIQATIQRYRRVAAATDPSTMRQLIIDTETTGLDPQLGPPHHRAGRDRGRQPPRDRPHRSFPHRPRARDRRRRDRGARHDVGGPQGQAEISRRRGRIPRLRARARNGSSTTRRSTSHSWTPSSRRPACRRARKFTPT